jgi:hypothetical protein
MVIRADTGSRAGAAKTLMSLAEPCKKVKTMFSFASMIMVWYVWRYPLRTIPYPEGDP